MHPKSDEHTINDALGEVLKELGANWSVQSEDLAALHGGGRLDVLIEKPDGWPVVIEAEVLDNTSAYDSAEKEATSRLRRKRKDSTATIHNAVALLYPKHLRRHSGASLRNALKETTFEYALLTADPPASTSRFPAKGWLKGDIVDLAILVHKSSIPASLVDQLTDAMETCIRNAAALLGNKTAKSKAVARLLGQDDDEDGQSRRMAMAVVANALVFHAILSETELHLDDLSNIPATRLVQSPAAMRTNARFQSPSQICDEWEKILHINYWPIFHKANQILKVLSPNPAAAVLDALWPVVERMTTAAVSKSHDLTGSVFQKLIADRQFLAAYYTRPPAASLLVGLAMPARKRIDTIMRIGDFSCGTGTLLSTAYHRFGLLHEIHGTDPQTLHPAMMRDGLAGLDVLNIAVHLTSSMLAGSHARKPFTGECLLTMPYGEKEDSIHVGSLEFLSNEVAFESLQAAVKVAGGKGETDTRNLIDKVKDNTFDLVIMNPPFTRSTSHEGEVRDVPNPAFAAFKISAPVQARMAKRLKLLAKSGCGDGNAGMASYFVDLGYRKTKPEGTLALVLPLTALSGISWKKVRALWRNRFSDRIVVTTADGSSFSADTSIAECLFIGRKKRNNANSHAHFVVLHHRPNTTVEGELLASEIDAMLHSPSLRRLESGPFGASSLMLGAQKYGEMLRATIPDDDLSWKLAAIADLSLAQAAHRFELGTLQFDDRMRSLSVAVCPMSKLCKNIGPVHRDITGREKDERGMFRGPFELETENLSPADPYPILWAHHQERQQSMTVQPDRRGIIRNGSQTFAHAYIQTANRLWHEFASPLHYSCDLNFNSQRILAAMTPTPSLGGRAWPSIVMKNPHLHSAFILWCNSTLGVMSHWWMATRTQPGRATSSITGFSNFAIFDLSTLDETQLQKSHAIFSDMETATFMPFTRISEDPLRAELDRRLLNDILSLEIDEDSLTRLRLRLTRELAKR